MLTALRMSQEQRIDDEIPLDNLDHLLEDLVTDTARLSPTPCEISKIPPEIISEIFLHCLLNSRPRPGELAPRPSDAPMLLGRICRQWREIALWTPELWKEIELTDHNSQGICFLLDVWLTRAGRADGVHPVSVAWKVIERFAHQELADLRFLEGWFPSLKHLFLSAARYHNLKQAPNLTDCVFLNLPNDGQLLPRVPPLIHIQSFHLVIGEHHIWLLEALTLPALRDLTLSMRADEVPRFHAFLSRCSCRLRSLSLATDMHDTSLLQCFRHAAMPSLERLQVTAEGPNTCTTIYRSIRDDGDFFPILRGLEIYEWLPDVSLDSEVGYDVLLLDALLNLKVPDVSKLRTMYEQGMLINVEIHEGTFGDVKVRRI
ncbi:hypothetical protein B0H10DRAFT_2012412 [Mycena sp. CBHHK59/15]|nr:hypothetical protein B0H10DRAFT_2012412 [Mycena sp. CBHHK59/15]